MTGSVFISQKANYASDFGIVNRSSTVFYFVQGGGKQTTVSFMNYWQEKNNLSTLIIASVRTMSGDLVFREQLNFEKGSVINYSPRFSETVFEGSIEIETFATVNLRIPYSAIVAVYKYPRSQSMVHSYSRVYSPHEVEEGRIITDGEESCWTIRDKEGFRSVGVFHNGTIPQVAQTAVLEVINSSNNSRSFEVDLPSLSPYETIKLYPSDHFLGLSEFLDGQPGNASVSFKTGNSFTRMLVGNESVDGSEFQITHSNFNYSKHITDQLSKSDTAYMNVPQFTMGQTEVVVYPDSSPGEYQAEGDGFEVTFESGQRVMLPGNEQVIRFTRKDGVFPTRLVTGLSGKITNAEVKLPFEISLGVHHSERPPSRSRWGLVATDDVLRSRIVVHDLDYLYGGIGNEQLEFLLFSATSKLPMRTRVDPLQLMDVGSDTFIDDIFPEAHDFLSGELGHYFVRPNYGGLMIYSTLEGPNGSMTTEHCF